MTRLRLAVAVFVLAVVGVVASAVVLLPEDDAPGEGEMPSGLTGTVVTDPTPAVPVIPTLPPTPDPDRNVPEVTLFDVTTGEALPLWRTDLFVLQAEFSPDGRWVYYVALSPLLDVDSANIYRIDLANPQASPEHLGQGFGMRISSRGDLAYVAVRGKDDYLPTVLAANGSRHELLPGIGGQAFVWSPDGRWLAYSQGYQADSRTYRDYLLDTRTWQSRTYANTLPCQCDRGAVPMWSPDSSRFTYVRLDPKGPVALLMYPVTLASMAIPSNQGWLDEHRFLARTQTNDGAAVFVYDLQSLARVPIGSAATVSPNGSLLATVAGPGEKEGNTTILRPDGTVVAAGLEGEIHSWANDASLVLTVSRSSGCGPVALLVHRTQDSAEVLCRNSPSPTSATFSPEGRYLALFAAPAELRRTSDYIGTASLVDLASGAERVLSADLRGFGGACLRWSPDGRFVLVGVCEGI